jgi:hypothetical protein
MQQCNSDSLTGDPRVRGGERAALQLPRARVGAEDQLRILRHLPEAARAVAPHGVGGTSCIWESKVCNWVFTMGQGAGSNPNPGWFQAMGQLHSGNLYGVGSPPR